MSCHSFNRAFELIDHGVHERMFPGAVAAIGHSRGVYRTGAAGNRCIVPATLPVLQDTLFDLASLTKVVATTTLFMLFLERGIISAFDPVSRYAPGFSTGVKKNITLKKLLTHTSGLPAHTRLDLVCRDRNDALDYIAEMPLEANPGSKVIYSCLGFILLGHILEETGGDSLDILCRKHIFKPLGMNRTTFAPAGDNIAATEYEEGSGRVLIGCCHDENARFLGGVAGNAGLFSNIGDLCLFAAMMLNKGKHDGKQFLSPASVAMMTCNYTAEMNEDRGLGWSIKGKRLHDTDEKAESAGDLLSPESYGHTGFTGTSIWIDPMRDLYVILLTNRVHPSRDNMSIFRFRKLFHNAVAAECGI